MSLLKINGRKIKNGLKPYIIAELSANHNGSIDTAKEIIRVAKEAGADAVKLQTYRPDTITLDHDSAEFMIEDGLWKGSSLYQLYESAYMPWDWHKPLFEYAKSLEITIFSSPFDNSAVDLLEDLNAPAYKIASFEAVDTQLIQYAASTGKPLIISTGMADAQEIQGAIDAAHAGGCKELAILHCVSGYPAPAGDYNLRTIQDMQQRYQLPVGLSDHTIGNITAITSTAFGACIIEKHVTLNRSNGGPDDSFSIEPNELKQLCEDVDTAWHAIGDVSYQRKSSEKSNLKFRRSLYFVANLKAGEMINQHHIRSIRPGYGLPPKYFTDVIGRIVKKDIVRGTKVSWELLSE